ncbi:hypothetical protein [Rheinheimera texasensis]|uniref:hypothetical protein n=1 Tax=Rheinheimera texasensis TaxID=306205 RepID=UPI0004E26EE8|nr:hypothetical protein [Rheinheimera texasensis]
MTDLSIQRNSTIASAYVSTAAAPAAAKLTPQASATATADSVSISSEAQKLFEQSIVDEPITPMNGGGIRPPDEPPAKPVKD